MKMRCRPSAALAGFISRESTYVHPSPQLAAAQRSGPFRHQMSLLACMHARSCNIMIMHDSLCNEVQELKAWAKPPRTPGQISAFVEDLSEWLSFSRLYQIHVASGANVMTEARSSGTTQACNFMTDTSTVGANVIADASTRGANVMTDARSSGATQACKPPPGSLLPLMAAEARRPELLQMMSEVGGEGGSMAWAGLSCCLELLT